MPLWPIILSLCQKAVVDQSVSQWLPESEKHVKPRDLTAAWYIPRYFCMLEIIIKHITEFPLWNKSANCSFSAFRSEGSKAKSVKSTFVVKQQYARVENLSLWCQRDSGKRKYYQEGCSGRLASKQNVTRVKGTINYQDLPNPEMRLYSSWGKQQDWGPPFCSILLQG